jgi:hypothetical protein
MKICHAVPTLRLLFGLTFNGNEVTTTLNGEYGNNVEYIIFSFIVLGRDGMDWIDMAQDRDQWMALVNTVMNIRVP